MKLAGALKRQLNFWLLEPLEGICPSIDAPDKRIIVLPEGLFLSVLIYVTLGISLPGFSSPV